MGFNSGFKGLNALNIRALRNKFYNNSLELSTTIISLIYSTLYKERSRDIVIIVVPGLQTG